jgi:predicted Rossmann fold flavoprotein
MSTQSEHIGAHYDVIVIGGGASGMMAAGRAAENGKRVLLVEKNKELGKKLSITGGGRCNITNAEKDTRKLLSHYGDAAKFLFSPFSQFGMKDTFTFFASRGLPLVVEGGKRAFPETHSAPDVTATLKKYMTDNRVTLKTGIKVTSFIVREGKIVGIETPKESFSGDTFILATGGSSHQETGSTGEGIQWLEGLGHTVHKPNPNIVPLKVEDSWVKELSGTALPFMKITFTDLNNSKKLQFSKTGRLLFTHFGLTGPLILNAAHEVKTLLKHGPVRAYIDLYPDTEVGTLRNRILEAFTINKNKALRNVLKEFAPAGMQSAITSLLPTELREKKVHSVTKEERYALVDMLKGMPMVITGTMGYEWAVVSDGGVELSEIDTKTMRSLKHDNLFFTGDVLNITRPSGGYSLQLCWTTAWVAANNV